MFYKYFGDPIGVNSINARDYIKLIIAAKNILLSSGMIILPYVISSRVMRLITRNNLNKKEMIKLENSEIFQSLKKTKYINDDIEKQILSTIATILSSDFEVIDYHDSSINGIKLETISDYIIDEVSMYVSLI